MTQSMTYKDIVNYELMDPFKRDCQEAARTTAHHLEQFGYQEVEWSRGESAYLYETPDCYRARVNEGLGTKNLAADAMRHLTNRSWYDVMAIDTIAMIVNDMATLGALPITVDMHVAAGKSEWFQDSHRCRDLIQGWRRGCDLTPCTWAGGETPTLKGMVESETVILSGSADGEIRPKERVIKPCIEAGDEIVLLEGSGIHANGLSLARRIAESLPHGYLTQLPNKRTFGEALLQPTPIYVPVIKALLDSGVELHGAVHITGHGWSKLMRAIEPFIYVMDTPGDVPPLFQFMQQHAQMSDKEAYGTFNMGAGFALYVPPHEVDRVIKLAAQENIKAWRGGHVEKRGDEKKVIIKPKGKPSFELDSLHIR